jgi:hypothetical protein
LATGAKIDHIRWVLGDKRCGNGEHNEHDEACHRELVAPEALHRHSPWAAHRDRPDERVLRRVQ